MRVRRRSSNNVNLKLFFLATAPAAIVACNSLWGIESGVLGLCADGTRIEDTNCENAATSGSGGFGNSSSSGGAGGAGGSPCETPWQRYDPVGDRCYLQEFLPREWASAEQRCVDLGGHLVAIDSANELGVLAEWVGPEVWIGGTDAGNEGTFVWTNGQEWSFVSWESGEPMDPGGNKDCVMLITPSGSLPSFDCRSCTDKRPFVCESLPLHP